MTAVWQDVKYGLRMLRRSPAFTAVAVLTLALGIGANTAIFSMVDWLLLRPLPVKTPGQMAFLVVHQESGGYSNAFSYPNFEDIRAQSNAIFSSLAAVQPFQMDGLRVDGKNLQIWTSYVSGDFFEMMGIRPALGRYILPSEGKRAGADRILVLGYAYWQAHFSGDPGIVGKKATVNGQPVTIVGVAPKNFHGAIDVLDTQGYLPLGMAGVDLAAAKDFLTNRDTPNLILVGRLRPGMSVPRAQPALNVLARRMEQQYPAIDHWRSLEARPLTSAPIGVDPSNPIPMVAGFFLFLAGLVLLLACLNVANLLLVRASARSREMAVRAALGAGRGRLVRQMVTESILLAVLGGAAGIVLGIQLSRLLRAVRIGSAIPLVLNFGFNWRVFAYALAAALATGIVLGLLPALRVSRSGVSEVLHEGKGAPTAGRQRLRSVLAAAEVAGSLMLLIVAGLFVRSLQAVQHVDLGFEPAHIFNVSMDPHEAGYDAPKAAQFFRDLLGRVRRLPGVQSASVAASVPMGLYSYGGSLKIPGYQPAKGQEPPSAGYNAVTPGYLATMRIALLEGRDFLDSDDAVAPAVAIINESMARKYWPGRDPIGRQFALARDPHRPVQVVGVVRDCRIENLSSAIEPYFYLAFEQLGVSPATFEVQPQATLQARAAAAPESISAPILGAIRSLEPAMPVFDVQTMTQALDSLDGLMLFRWAAVLAGGLGMLGLSLAIVGVYGVVSYAASQRTHEIGIRVALGAQRRQILEMVVRQGLVIVVAGLGLGLLATLGISRLVAGLLTGVAGTDPLTYAGVSILLALVALAACYIPARRATRISPALALREE